MASPQPSGGAAPPPPSSITGASSAPSTSVSSSSSAVAASPSAPSFLSHIAGVPADFGSPVHVNVKKPIQRQINSIFGWTDLDRAPMTLPQSFVRGNEPQVGEHPYFVSERSVGVRYLVVLVQGRCYLVSQNYDVREAILFAPVRPDRLQPGTDRNAIVPHQWTILDGLLVCDKENNKSVLTMIVNDILALNGTPVLSSKLQDRLKLVQNDVIGPRKQIPLPKGQPPDQFQLVQQYMYPLNRISYVIRTLVPRITQTRQNAGLMFTPVMLPYTPGHAKGLFTWTPAQQLTVDFQLGVEWRGRPPKPGFKLMLHDKRMQIFHDWITFAPEEFEFFRTDKRAPSRIVECVYDPDWLTFVPSHDKTTWEGGSPEFYGTERGQGWRKGGWRFVRCRSDRGSPVERSHLAVIEKAIGEDVRVEEIEALFPEDPSKKPVSTQPKPRDPPPQVQEDYSSSKKKRGLAPGTGVCYDFQNKGVCQRGRACHFSHCACNSTCTCTTTKNTYGQRPTYRRTDFDAPPSPDTSPSSDPSMPPEKSLLRQTESYDRDHSAKADLGDEEEAGELTDSVNLNMASVYAPLENFDKETLAAKRAQLTALGNRRIWASLGLEDKASRKRTCGLIVSKTGEINIVRASDKIGSPTVADSLKPLDLAFCGNAILRLLGTVKMKRSVPRPAPDLKHNDLQIPILDGTALKKLATEPNSSKFAIDAHNRAITEIRDLSELPKLCSLDVSFNRLTSLKNVPTAKELRELKAYNNNITTLRFLKGTGNLEGLLVHENQIDEIAEDLLALVKLKSLWLNGNRITNVQNLGACRLLVHLDLSRNRLTGAAAKGLESLSSLEYLNLSGNQIASIGNLTHLTKLEELNLATNRVATLEGGLLPANLTVLRLNDNKLTSLHSFPPYLTKLNELYLQDNAMIEIGEHAAKFPELESLDLRNNCIRSVAQLQTGLAGCAALADLWIHGNPCCLSTSYLLELIEALPGLRTLDSMTDTQFKAQVGALRNGIITQDALLASMARPMTPMSSRPGSASSYRPMTPSSAGSSRPATPDRGAPVFHQPSMRSGALLKVASPEELEWAHAEVAERLKSMKAMLGRVGNGGESEKEPVGRTRNQRVETTSNNRKPSIQEAKMTSEPEVHDNQSGDAPQNTNHKKTPHKSKASGVDAGTDPLDSLVGNQPVLPRSTRTPDINTPRRAMETQTPGAPTVMLPPAPVSVPALSTSKSQLMDAAAMTADEGNQGTEDVVDGDAIEQEMKQLLLAYATPRDQKGAAEEPQDDDDATDEPGESPRIVGSKVAEQRLPPNPRSRQGYRTFRVPARLRTTDAESMQAPVNAV